MRTPLPIDDSLPSIVRALHDEGAVALLAPAGAGKTTRVPPAIAEADPRGGRILVLEPRRVAARAAAARMARERGWTMGREVGWQVRGERRADGTTRILVVTEGIAVRLLQDDPFLEGVDTVILDEFHERSLHADLALAMLRQVRSEARPDLRIVVMSATFHPAPVADWIGRCAVVEVEGRTHPVEIRHLDMPADGPVAAVTARGIRLVLERTAGDVLAFLPGVGEIRATQERLDLADARVMPLHGSMPLGEQEAVLARSSTRKVVLATNVAETSVTIDGIGAVVDSGLARVLRHDPGLGIDRLEVERVSRASMDQRAGRAGRTGPGVCLRLWTRAEERGGREETDPEIRRVDLSGVVMEILLWGEDPRRFAWWEAPDPESVERAFGLLDALGAVRDDGLTERGRRMARLPLHPRLARLVLEGHALGHGDAACLVAALLSERSVVRPVAAGPRWSSPSDVLDRLSALRGEPGPFRRSEIDRGATRRVPREAERIAGIAVRVLGHGPEARCDEEEALLRAIASAWGDRLARRRGVGSDRGVMRGGRGVRLVPESAVRDADLFVCVEAVAGRRGERSESLVRQASEVRPGWIEGLATRMELEWDGDCVREIERTRSGDLVVSERPGGGAAPEAVAAVLAREVLGDPVRLLGLDGEPARSWIERVRFLAHHAPELDLPDPASGERLEVLVTSLCAGCRCTADLARAPVLEAMKGMLQRESLLAVDREAPERIQVPSGSRIRLAYDGTAPPVLAVRIQEMFGATDTPRVARGRVPVMLHLLAPNMRPQQVTRDLGSFWSSTYPQVRKELRSRYPKHDWPEDPLRARPRRRPGRGRR